MQEQVCLLMLSVIPSYGMYTIQFGFAACFRLVQVVGEHNTFLYLVRVKTIRVETLPYNTACLNRLHRRPDFPFQPLTIGEATAA